MITSDLLIRPLRPSTSCGWLVEFKYLKSKEATEEAVAAKLAEAEAQLGRHASARNIAEIDGLRRAAVVFAGTRLAALTQA